MNKELNIGDYVRTNTGIIGKITDMKIEDDFLIRKRYGDRIYLDNNRLCLTEDIIKSSPNIIDLIEVGDYVNGVIVTQSYIDNIKHIAPEIKENNYGIKSIVTREMFESMEYKIGE